MALRAPFGKFRLFLSRMSVVWHHSTGTLINLPLLESHACYAFLLLVAVATVCLEAIEVLAGITPEREISGRSSKATAHWQRAVVVRWSTISTIVHAADLPSLIIRPLGLLRTARSIRPTRLATFNGSIITIDPSKGRVNLVRLTG